jgi:hypothetical protein
MSDEVGATAEAFARLALELHGEHGVTKTAEAVLQFALTAVDRGGGCSAGGVAVAEGRCPQAGRPDPGRPAIGRRDRVKHLDRFACRRRPDDDPQRLDRCCGHPAAAISHRGARPYGRNRRLVRTAHRNRRPRLPNLQATSGRRSRRSSHLDRPPSRQVALTLRGHPPKQASSHHSQGSTPQTQGCIPKLSWCNPASRWSTPENGRRAVSRVRTPMG